MECKFDHNKLLKISLLLAVQSDDRFCLSNRVQPTNLRITIISSYLPRHQAAWPAQAALAAAAAPPPPPYAWKVPFHCPLRSCSPGRPARDPVWLPGPADSSLLDRLES